MEAGGSRVRSFVLTFGHAALERFCFSFLCRAGDSKHLSKFRDFISHTLLTSFSSLAWPSLDCLLPRMSLTRHYCVDPVFICWRKIAEVKLQESYLPTTL